MMDAVPACLPAWGLGGQSVEFDEGLHVQLFNVFMAYIKHHVNLTWRCSPTMSVSTTTSCTWEVTTDTLHNLGPNPCCKSSTGIGYLKYTFKYCGAMALPATWAFVVTTIRGMAVVGALLLHPMPMSTVCNADLSEHAMQTHAYAPGTVRKPTIKQPRANCEPHVLTLM